LLSHATLGIARDMKPQAVVMALDIGGSDRSKWWN